MEKSKLTTTKNIIISIITIIVVFTAIILIFENLKKREPRKIIKYDYLLKVNQDSMYIFNNKDTIYIQKLNWDNPGKLEKAIMDYNQ